MNREIVITITEVNELDSIRRWQASIYGQVGTHRTEKKTTTALSTPEGAMRAAADFYMDKIEEWTEQL